MQKNPFYNSNPKNLYPQVQNEREGKSTVSPKDKYLNNYDSNSNKNNYNSNAYSTNPFSPQNSKFLYNNISELK